MTPSPSPLPSFPRSAAGGRTASGGTVRAVASVAVLAAFATGCRNDTAPPWGYPDLKATLGSLSRALDEGCAGAAPESCADDLDRLGALADRAFDQALEHRLLDAGYVDAVTDLARARELRAATAADAGARRDPRYAPFRRAVAAEMLAYRRLLAALERVRTAPPPGDGTDPV
ncbi:hypothetical protein HYE82_29395 [Streptomyces sp. BR123]|uniref:hypothetical protein n=1 Tax=Streptomyces sp. BR123 TaxID=2749828 RepID=UPI0015C43AA9|nr:hypothetical protein [Streptomyces sp. BR123]NXY98418.1 hypothetical protein [Streptomyces sp. BR123]